MENIPAYVYPVGAIALLVFALAYVGALFTRPSNDNVVIEPPKPKHAIDIVATNNVDDVKGVITNVRWFHHT